MVLVLPCEPCTYSPEGALGAFFESVDPSTRGALLFPPMFEERRCAHRVMTELCSGLAAGGFHVLHPDLFGCGNGPGCISQASLERWKTDIHAALEYLERRGASEEIFFIGCRLGALLAAWYLGLNPDAARRTLLLNPVVSGRAYLSAARKRRLIQDSITDAAARPEIDPHEVEGQILSEHLYNELRGLDLAEMKAPRDVRVFQCSFNTKPSSDLRRLLHAWGETFPLECIVAQPFWNPHSPMGYDEIIEPLLKLLLQ